jgi:hypothetical protein
MYFPSNGTVVMVRLPRLEQGPLPYQLGRGFPTVLCPVSEFRLSERFTAF